MSVEQVQTTAPVVEQPKPSEKPPQSAPSAPVDQKPDEMSAKFAALAKKERIARLAQHNLKQKEAAIAKREAEIAAREQAWENEFKTSPLEAIKKRGYSYEDMTKAALNDGKFDPEAQVKEVKSEIQKLRDQQAEEKRLAQEQAAQAQKQAEQEAVETFKGKIGEHIEANKEKFELTSLYDASELVYQTVEEHFERTKKVLSIEEACGLVESYLESELERTAQTSKKFQAKYLAQKAAEAAKGKEPPKTSTTLTNEHTSTAASLLPAHTENDRIKRALAKLG